MKLLGKTLNGNDTDVNYTVPEPGEARFPGFGIKYELGNSGNRFALNRSATSITDATFVGIVTEMTRSDIRRTWSDLDIDLDEIGEEATTRASSFSYEAFARKDSAGIQNWLTNSDDDEEEANISITVVECWIRSDRDGDGIAELKHVIKAGDTILE